MTMKLLGWGALLVLLDLRLNGFDLLPDIAGWVLITVALWRLAPLGPLLQLAQFAAVLGAISSAFSFALFFSEQPLALLRELAELGSVIAWVGVCWWGLGGLAVAAGAGDPAAAGQARRLARVLAVVNLVAVVGECVAMILVLAGRQALDVDGGFAAVPLAVFAIVFVVANLALVAFCFQHADRAWALTERGLPRAERA